MECDPSTRRTAILPIASCRATTSSSRDRPPIPRAPSSPSAASISSRFSASRRNAWCSETTPSAARASASRCPNKRAEPPAPAFTSSSVAISTKRIPSGGAPRSWRPTTPGGGSSPTKPRPERPPNHADTSRVKSGHFHLLATAQASEGGRLDGYLPGSEQEYEEEARDKSADVGPPRGASPHRRRDLEKSAQDLEHKPQSQDHKRGKLDHL